MSLFFILYVKHDNDLVPSIFFADFNWSQGFNFLKIFRNFNLKRCRFKYSAEETTLHELFGCPVMITNQAQMKFKQMSNYIH